MVDYLKLYEIIGDLTPIKADCGSLCQKACCTGDSDTGMYLYPGEEELYTENLGFGKVFTSDFCYKLEKRYKRVDIFICDRPCDRLHRPLACRVFPFVPYIDSDGNAEIILDPRADVICPLARHGDEVAFDEEFLDRLSEAFAEGLEDAAFAAFVKAQSKLIDEFEEMQNKFPKKL